MKNIKVKNYIYLSILFIITIIATLFFSNLYLKRTRNVSELYKNSSIITTRDFSAYITENPDAILYIADKFDLRYQDIEEKLRLKLEALNLKEYFIYINGSSKFINKLNKDYKMKFNINEMPIIVVFLNGTIVEYKSIDNNMNVDNIINYGVFEW